jgi:hypothetical protein
MEKQNLLETEENEEFKNMAKNVWINVLTCKKKILYCKIDNTWKQIEEPQQSTSKRMWQP